MEKPIINVYPTPAVLVADMADKIVEAARVAAKNNELLSLFLSGGSTPKALHEKLASDDYRKQIDWRGVEIFFGDERCVPPTSDLSNYKMALDTLISKVPIPPDNVYRMKGEIDPNEAAKQYGLMLKEKFMDAGPDVLLLGMGDDGHTASLFPGTEALAETHHRCMANHVPYDYIPAGTNWRITLTYPFINRSRGVYVLATGAAKAKRIQEVLEGDDERFPIQRVKPDIGTMTWMMDADAAGMHEDVE
ncbi:MAG: 6-phosphogluconolactonase [Phycisphaerales bacterium]|nr:6-phosphogluconolactonase [Phycisphaerales bacterium]